MVIRLCVAIGVLLNLASMVPAQESTPTAAEKIRIAVADFATSGDVGIPEAGRSVSELLLTEFGSDKFQLIERSMLASLLKEKDLSITDIVDNPALLKDKGVKGVRYLVLGKVIKLGNLSISARLVDVGTGEIVRTARVSADNAKGLQDAIGVLALQLQMNEQERREQKDLAPYRRLRTEIHVRATESGKISCLGQESQVSQKKWAVFTNIPCGQVLEMRFTPSGGVAAETFRVDIRRNRIPRLGCILVSTKGRITESRGGVPHADSLPPGDSTNTASPVVWTDAARETACLSAIMNTIRQIGDKVSGTEGSYVTRFRESDSMRSVSRFNFDGATLSSETVVKEDVAQSDKVHAEFGAGDDPLTLSMDLFVIDSPKSPRDRSLSKKIREQLKTAGFSDFKEEFDPSEYTCRMTMSFRGWILFEKKGLQ